MWNLASGDHYDAIVAVMKKREELKPYIKDINVEAASSGLPMVRPMFLQFPLDTMCQGSDVEDQFMFGPNWLVAPVYVYQATSRSVYLPQLSANQSWVHAFSGRNYGAGGQRLKATSTLAFSSINLFCVLSFSLLFVGMCVREEVFSGQSLGTHSNN